MDASPRTQLVTSSSCPSRSIVRRADTDRWTVSVRSKRPPPSSPAHGRRRTATWRLWSNRVPTPRCRTAGRIRFPASPRPSASSASGDRSALAPHARAVAHARRQVKTLEAVSSLVRASSAPFASMETPNGVYRCCRSYNERSGFSPRSGGIVHRLSREGNDPDRRTWDVDRLALGGVKQSAVPSTCAMARAC